MPIEIGQVIIQCDSCLEKMVHDPSPDPISSFTSYPRWSSKDAIMYARNNGWVMAYNQGANCHDVQCPSCASEMAAVKFNRSEQGKIIAKNFKSKEILSVVHCENCGTRSIPGEYEDVEYVNE